uniref:Uncharacterized protein n=1 Tax=Musca domestica TaxID=7370 RepID=A0A1I8NJ47_MUSDO
MNLKGSFCCCCRKAQDTQSVKSWTPGRVNENFQKEDSIVTAPPKVTITASDPKQIVPVAENTPSSKNHSMASDGDDGASVSKIDLNLNIFENERFGDMAAIIYKSQMSLDKI